MKILIMTIFQKHLFNIINYLVSKLSAVNVVYSLSVSKTNLNFQTQLKKISQCKF